MKRKRQAHKGCLGIFSECGLAGAYDEANRQKDRMGS
jgi:hypothetical protein